MKRQRPPLGNRGTDLNPANRFVPIVYEPDPEIDGENGELDEPSPRTSFLKDTARSIISYNDSPDVPFDASVNVYRGCEHGCIYCVDGETPILMADGTTRFMGELQVGNEIYGTERQGWYRHYVKTRVKAHWEVRKPAYRLMLEDGTELIASADHRFLTLRGWKFVVGAEQGAHRRPHLTTNDKLLGIGQLTAPSAKNHDYRIGYVCGIVRGDGLLASYEYERQGRKHGNQHQFRLALVDDEALGRAEIYLGEFGVPTRRFVFSAATENRKEVRAIRTQARERVNKVRQLIGWPTSPSRDWRRGFLAGIFDAEGSCSSGTLRIPNSDSEIVEQVAEGFRHFEFSFARERVEPPRARSLDVLRLKGGLREQVRFFHTVDPAIRRKCQIDGAALKGSANLRVAAIEPLGRSRPLFDITTGTGDFIANGVVSHNCYARPTHEYFGFSAGLDFETKILVKENAPELLRKELASPRWKPQVLAMSGVTDPYQPIEGKLRLTRRCLEVLRDFRNPVAIVTKNHLVRRDADLLRELAQFDASAVFLSVTTLRRDLHKVLEPRTVHPERRLEAIRELAQAGIPVGVLVAPVIPGLTDHELPSIVEAAAAAGAQSAAYIMLRLPGAVAELFEDWLERHFPDRKRKVMNRIRSLRGGKISDSRFGRRMQGEGIFAEQVAALFKNACGKAGIGGERPTLSTEHFRRPGDRQLEFF